MARVLLVDDDEAIRETLRFILEDAGYSVVEATNGLEALDVIYTSVEPLVVLLDIVMPRLSGAGVLGVVAEDEQLATQNAFVLVTANPSPFPKPFTLLTERLCVAIVNKPFDIDDVLTAVTEACHRLPLQYPYLGNYPNHLEQQVQG